VLFDELIEGANERKPASSSRGRPMRKVRQLRDDIGFIERLSRLGVDAG